MPAAVETAGFANTGAWHNLGKVVDTKGNKGMTIEQALPATGLDWEVRKVPAWAPLDYEQNGDGDWVPTQGSLLAAVPGRYNIQRTSDKKMLGNVGEIFEPIQNKRGFAIVDDFIQVASDEGGAPTWIESGGSLHGGAKVWILAHVEESMFIAGEQYATYVLFANGHDGRSSLIAAIVTVRVVCQNTLTWALSSAPRVIRIRHTVNAENRMKEARAILGLRNVRNEQLAKQGEWLVEQEMPDADFDKFSKGLMPIKNEEDESPAKTMITKRRDEVAEIFHQADNLAPIRGTRWAALQAVTEYADYRRPFKNTESQLVAQFGMNDQAVKIKDSAVKILTSPKLEVVPA